METIGDDPDEMGDHLPAVDLGSGRSAQQVACGAWHTCALLDDFSVKCWGAGLSTLAPIDRRISREFSKEKSMFELRNLKVLESSSLHKTHLNNCS